MVAVVGIGNVLLGDDGVGVWIARELLRAYRFAPAIDVIDGGTLGLALLADLRGTDRLLIVDAAQTAHGPGFVSTLRAPDVRAMLRPLLSAHDASLNDLLAALTLLGTLPSDIAVIGIQPLSLLPSVGLSVPVRAAMPAAAQAVIGVLASWGVVSSRNGVREQMTLSL